VTLLVGPGTVVTSWEGPELCPEAGIAIDGDRVARVDAWDTLLRDHPEAARLDARGALVIPGFVNLHHHFYSALARGLDPGPGLTDFYEVLRRLWWRLDRALDPEAVRLSALLSLGDSIRAGVTTVFDHHASPSCAAGSLGVIASAVEDSGLSAVLCFEASDRNGGTAAREGLEENARFFASPRSDGRVRGMLGLHASFTLGDDTLFAAAALAAGGMGCHVHCVEAETDDILSHRIASLGALERLDACGLLGPRTLLAHGVHLSHRALARAAERGALLVHNPESNLHNGVGRLDPEAARGAGVSVGLGTDGLGSSILGALRAALLSLRDLRRDPAAGFAALLPMLATNARVAARFLDEPLLGTLVPGAPADVAVLAEASPAPVTRESLAAHLVYGPGAVRHTLARGRVVLSDFATTTLDAAAIAAEARRLSPALRTRFEALEPVPDRDALVAHLTRSIPAMEGFA
jgi:putative selenium metabolism protein SsnA